MAANSAAGVTTPAEPNQGKKPRLSAKYSDQGTQGPKVKVYQYRQDNGTMAFSDKPPADQRFSVLLYDCFACDPASKVDWRTIKLHRSFDKQIREAANTYALEPALIRAVIHAESGFNPKAVSRTGAMGLMQLMPETARELGVRNAFAPEQNILGGSRYLAKMLKRFDGKLDQALAAYNAGATTVQDYRGVPPYPETRAYIERVNILLKRYRNFRV
ncbi:lytic transglycosylase domain-containing protein [Shewanella cyperi]|uniref:lytic transglycosylase domain-containing protein n=1 Tax=Shewanella cyperi TaxID=2814292 RepID=UPI001D17F4BA|nr:lytic transglycosylase domain-containing protein [Shewanella cyperi]